jgi:hypothetical protein
MSLFGNRIIGICDQPDYGRWVTGWKALLSHKEPQPPQIEDLRFAAGEKRWDEKLDQCRVSWQPVQGR